MDYNFSRRRRSFHRKPISPGAFCCLSRIALWCGYTYETFNSHRNLLLPLFWVTHDRFEDLAYHRHRSGSTACLYRDMYEQHSCAGATDTSVLCLHCVAVAVGHTKSFIFGVGFLLVLFPCDNSFSHHIATSASLCYSGWASTQPLFNTLAIRAPRK